MQSIKCCHTYSQITVSHDWNDCDNFRSRKIHFLLLFKGKRHNCGNEVESETTPWTSSFICIKNNFNNWIPTAPLRACLQLILEELLLMRHIHNQTSSSRLTRRSKKEHNLEVVATSDKLNSLTKFISRGTHSMNSILWIVCVHLSMLSYQCGGSTRTNPITND